MGFCVKLSLIIDDIVCSGKNDYSDYVFILYYF